MYSVRFVNVAHSIDLALDHLRISKVTRGKLFMGEITRTIGGDAISYNRGSKKEPSIDLVNISEAEKDILVAAQLGQYPVVYTLRDEYLQTVIETFTGYIDELAPSLDPLSRLYAFTVKIFEA